MSEDKENSLVTKEATEVAISPAQGPGVVLDLIGRMASDQSVDMNKVERLIGLHQEMVAKENETRFHEAMAAARAEIGVIVKNRENAQTKSSYADLGAVTEAISAAYKHGINITFDTGKPENGEMPVTASVSACGHTQEFHYYSPITTTGLKGGAMMTETHARATAITYGRRYLLSMIFNLGTVDNDGNEPKEIERVSEEQAANIRALIEDVGGSEPIFLKWIKADRVEDIQASAYDFCITQLEKKRK